MIKAHTQDLKLGWIYDEDHGISPEDAQEYCVNHAEWQEIRVSMKGKYTFEKLRILFNWRETNALANDGVVPKTTQLQICNYLGALRRGGQLDMNNMIAKAR